MTVVPVVLFAYARPAHLRRVLECLRADRVPQILAFADGARGPADAPAVAEVRGLLRAIDWAEVRLVERSRNVGLGANVLGGVSEVARTAERFVVWEDDLVAVPGTYAWICAALAHYAAEPKVMSISAWTHPRVVPASSGQAGYFDARAECWVWGSYARAWAGMETGSALDKMATASRRGIAPDAYGADLPAMARVERRKNIWAVRWLYHHLAAGGLCLRPRESLVEHIGFDSAASHAGAAQEWSNPRLGRPPEPPVAWPAPVEDPECAALWRAANPSQSAVVHFLGRIRRRLARVWKGRGWFTGDFATWADAAAGTSGYDSDVIVERVLAATLAVRAGEAAFERDGIAFPSPEPETGLVAALLAVAAQNGGRLRVMDFGGALGSTYWRHRGSFSQLAEVRWDVVEQARFVVAGRKHLGDSPLRFHETIEAAAASGPHDVLIASTVLQYLPCPHDALQSWLQLGLPAVILNNVPLHTRGPDRLARQRVPAEIYPASYPVWFFNRDRLLGAIEPGYRVASEFASEAVWPLGWRDYPSTGLWLARK